MISIPEAHANEERRTFRTPAACTPNIPYHTIPNDFFIAVFLKWFVGVGGSLYLGTAVNCMLCTIPFCAVLQTDAGLQKQCCFAPACTRSLPQPISCYITPHPLGLQNSLLAHPGTRTGDSWNGGKGIDQQTTAAKRKNW